MRRIPQCFGFCAGFEPDDDVVAPVAIPDQERAVRGAVVHVDDVGSGDARRAGQREAASGPFEAQDAALHHEFALAGQPEGVVGWLVGARGLAGAVTHPEFAGRLLARLGWVQTFSRMAGKGTTITPP